MYQTANEFDGVKTGTHMGLGNAQRAELESADLPVLRHMIILSRILYIGHDGWAQIQSAHSWNGESDDCVCSIQNGR